MKAEYDMILHIKVVHEIDGWELGGQLKGDREMADSIGQMICDEASICNGVASYDIIDSKVSVK